MVNESFVDVCFTILLNKKATEKIKKTTYRDILDVIKFYKKKEKDDISINIKNKLELLETVATLKLKNKSTLSIIDSVSEGEKFSGLIDFIKTKVEEEIEDTIIDDLFEQIRLRKKAMGLFKNYDKVTELMETVKNGSFSSLDEVVGDYDVCVKTMYTNLMECQRSLTVEATSTLDIKKDDYGAVVDLIKKKILDVNTIKTGFPVLDNILCGGFQKTRLYVFAGGSGSGKSTLMLNFIENGLCEIVPDAEKESVYVYITLENLVDESLLRLYQSMYQTTARSIYESIDHISEDYLKKAVLSKIEKSKRSLFMKYFPKLSISTADIAMVLDEAVSVYGKEGIRAVFVDYLDLLKSDVSLKNYDLYRLELSHITTNLKDLAVEYNVPVITASQLGREVYAKNPDSKALNMAMVGESIKKVENSDFIALMSKDQTVDDLVYMNVGKNRSGTANKSLEFKVDFSMFRFLNGYEVTNDKASNLKTDQAHHKSVSFTNSF